MAPPQGSGRLLHHKRYDVRGSRRDYDTWRQMGLQRWSYEEVLPYFKRAENNPERAGDDLHGQGGPLHVEKGKAANPIYAALIAAGIDEGFPASDDFNGLVQEGLGVYDFTIRNGRRVSTERAYLQPAKHRSNLEIWTKTHVSSIRLEDRRAVGLDLIRSNAASAISARREVILSAGAINSPQLLQLSGIGDPERLKPLGIEPKVARPAVGRNLQDHLGVLLTYAGSNGVSLYSLLRPDRAISSLTRAYFFGTGPAASSPLEAGRFLKTRPELDEPDVQLTFIPGLSLEMTRSGQRGHGYMISVYQLRPDSRGEVHIVSADPFAKPAMDPGYLKTEHDRQVMRDGTRLGHRIGANPHMAPFLAMQTAPLRNLSLTTKRSTHGSGRTPAPPSTRAALVG